MLLIELYTDTTQTNLDIQTALINSYMYLTRVPSLIKNQIQNSILISNSDMCEQLCDIYIFVLSEASVYNLVADNLV